MTNSILNILSEKNWVDHSIREKEKLSQLLIVWAVLGVFSVILLIYNLVFKFNDSCFICNAFLIAMNALAIICTLNGNLRCSINAVFSIPFILYAYYISDFSPHVALSETIYQTVFWLMAGLIFLIYFSETNFRIITYFVFALLTIAFQLQLANNLVESPGHYKPFITHPLIVFSGFFLVIYFLRNHYLRIIKKHEEEINGTHKSITKVLQDSQTSIALLIAERDEAGNIVQLIVEKVNNSFESNFKINLYEVQGQKADYIFNLIFKTKFDLNKLIHSNLKRNSEFHAVHLQRWFNIHVLQPDYNRFYVLFEDISKIKIKITELEENKRRYKVLLEAIPDIFFVIDKDGTYEDFVIKESDLFKMEDANIIGSTIFEVGFPDNMADKIFTCIQDCIESNSIETIEYSMNTPNGTFLFEMRLAKLNAHSVISVARDITKRKTAEFKLEKALIKAEESDRLKSVFLANLSHEIRTPLNIITNFTRFLSEMELDSEEKLEFTDAITQNGKQLLNMIENTIHLSKIETKSVVITKSFCKVNEIIRGIYNQYLILVRESKPIKIKQLIDVPNSEFGFETDPAILNQIISLLVDNAIKYTLKGEVIFGYEMIRNERIMFTVSDTGIGIPADEQQNIFKRFYRIKNDINESTSGSGNGLAIVQHYIVLLGGEIEFETAPDKGSKFWFSLPFKNGKGFLKVVS